MNRRIRIIEGPAKGKMGYANIAEDDDGNGLHHKVGARRHMGVWVTVDPEPAVAMGGAIAARPLVLWQARWTIHVLSPSEELGNIMSVIEQETICQCGHARSVHFANRCFTTAESCSCNQFTVKEST